MAMLPDLSKWLNQYFPFGDIPEMIGGRYHDQSEPWDYGLRNRHGYRSSEFDDRKQLNVACLGCSWVEGFGVNRDQIFSEVLANRLADLTGESVCCWNLGQSGAGFDNVARLIPSVVSTLDPDFVVLVVSGLRRREHFLQDGRRIFWNVTTPRRYEERGEKPTEKEQGLFDAFDVLQNDYEDVSHFLRHLHLVSSLLDARNIPWAFSWIEHRFADQTMQQLHDLGALPADHYLGQVFTRIDHSEVDQHPGPESHKQFAEIIIDFLRNGSVVKTDRLGEISDADPPPLGKSAKDSDGNVETSSSLDAGQEDGDDVYPLW